LKCPMCGKDYLVLKKVYGDMFRGTWSPGRVCSQCGGSFTGDDRMRAILNSAK